MLTYLTPPVIRAPFARYSHGVVVEAGARILFCSGQLGIGPDDTVPETALEQARLCFANIAAVLHGARMASGDIVRINGFVTDRGYWGDYMQARDEFLGDAIEAPASTLMIVTGFSLPALKVEVEVVAAGEPVGERSDKG